MSEPAHHQRTAIALFGLGSAFLIVAVLTLTPLEGSPDKLWSGCILCGERGLADAFSNVLLYFPVGLALAAWLGLPARAMLVALGVSAGVELLQIFIPGRDPNPADLLFNGLGAAGGIVLWRFWRRWLAPPRATASRYALGASGLAALGVLLLGVLFSPSLPLTRYFGQWTPQLGNLEKYGGSVVSADLGPVPIPLSPLEDSELVRSLILAGEPLRVEMVAGARPERLAAIISIFDENQREILFLGAERDDLVLRIRAGAAAWELDQPYLVFEDALRGIAAADPVSLSVSRNDSGYCLGMNRREHCGLAYSAADGWALIGPAGGARLRSATAPLGGVWLAPWFFALGLWARRTVISAAALAIGAGTLLFLPGFVGIGPTPVAGLVGAGLGAAAGWIVQRRVRRGTRKVISRNGRPLVLAQASPKFSRSVRYWE